MDGQVYASPTAAESSAPGALVHGVAAQQQEITKRNNPVPFHATAPAGAFATPMQDSESGDILRVLEQRVARLEDELEEAGKRENQKQTDVELMKLLKQTWEEDRERHTDKEKSLLAQIEKQKAEMVNARHELERLKWEQSQSQVEEDRGRRLEREKDIQAQIEKLTAELVNVRSELERVKWEQSQSQVVQNLKKPAMGASLEGADSGSGNSRSDDIKKDLSSPNTQNPLPHSLPKGKPKIIFSQGPPTHTTWTPPLSRSTSGNWPHQNQPQLTIQRCASGPIIVECNDEDDDHEGLAHFLNLRGSESEKPKRSSKSRLRRETTPERIDRFHKTVHGLFEQQK